VAFYNTVTEDRLCVKILQRNNTIMEDRLYMKVSERNNTAMKDGLFMKLDLIYNNMHINLS